MVTVEAVNLKQEVEDNIILQHKTVLIPRNETRSQQQLQEAGGQIRSRNLKVIRRKRFSQSDSSSQQKQPASHMGGGVTGGGRGGEGGVLSEDGQTSSGGGDGGEKDREEEAAGSCKDAKEEVMMQSEASPHRPLWRSGLMMKVPFVFQHHRCE